MTNQRGQAFVESLVLGLIIVTVITYSLKYALRAQKNSALDEFVEETLICMVGKQADCISKLRLRMTRQGYREISIQSRQLQSRWILHLKAISAFKEIVEKESELNYDLQVPI